MEYNNKTYSKPFKKKTNAAKVNSGSGFKVHGEGLKYKPKRGSLSKLMSEEEKAKAGIHELSYDFGCRITRLFQYLTEDAEYKEYVQ